MIKRNAWIIMMFGVVFMSGCKPTIITPEEGAFYSVPFKPYFKVRHDSGADLVFEIEHSDLQIPGQWPEIRYPVNTAVSNLVKESNTITTGTIDLFEAGSWYMRVRIDEPNEPWSDWRTIVGTKDGMSLAGALINIVPDVHTGPCPININVYGTVGSAIAGNVSSYFVRSDGNKTPTQTLTFDKPGTITVKSNMPSVGDGTLPSKGWVALVVKSLIVNAPEVTSRKAEYDVTCTE